MDGGRDRVGCGCGWVCARRLRATNPLTAWMFFYPITILYAFFLLNGARTHTRARARAFFLLSGAPPSSTPLPRTRADSGRGLAGLQAFIAFIA